MALFRQRLDRALIVWLALMPMAWAAPDSTLTIDPSATSGSTISAADENDRSGDISTWANSHDHNDIDQTANTLNVGDGLAGNKNLCGNAADSTDSCFRWDDTNNLWLVQQPDTNFNMVATITGTAGATSGGFLFGNGTSPFLVSAVLTNGQLPIGDGSGQPTLATLTEGAGITITNGAGTITVATGAGEMGTFTRDISAATGAVNYTGVGFQPRLVLFFAATEEAGEASWGMDRESEEIVIFYNQGVTDNTFQTTTGASIELITSAGNLHTGNITTMGTDGFTITWTKTGTPTGTATIAYEAWR